MLAKAFRFASEAHEGQCRKKRRAVRGNIPWRWAIILADLRMDVETLCAALLHDTVEDTSVTRDQVEAEFNPQVAQLVEGDEDAHPRWKASPTSRPPPSARCS